MADRMSLAASDRMRNRHNERKEEDVQTDAMLICSAERHLPFPAKFSTFSSPPHLGNPKLASI
jgi:hypothetical protein